MEVKIAEVSDAPVIHEIMIREFMEYKEVIPPSGALDETVQSISTALKNDEQCLIGYVEEKLVAIVRFQIKITKFISLDFPLFLKCKGAEWRKNYLDHWKDMLRTMVFRHYLVESGCQFQEISNYINH